MTARYRRSKMPRVTTGSVLSLPRIRARVLREQALGTLRSAILTNEIPAGTRLLEAQMASGMGISRAPVREALRQLEQEGLVTFVPHRGAIVVGVPDDEIDALYELRAVVEAKAIARACESLAEADLEELERYIDRMLKALRVGDVAQIADNDLLFHQHIVELSGFALLKRLWSSLDGMVRQRIYQATGQAARSFLRKSIVSHTAILDALRARNPSRAARVVSEHILEVPLRLHPAAKDGSRNPGRRSS